MLTAVAPDLPPPADRLDTLPPGLPEDHGFATLGYEGAAWAHRWLVQPNGPRSGQPFRLTDRQFRFLLWWYALDGDGRWLFHHGVRRLAKGAGKSPSAAVLALIEFCAPVRLDYFDPAALGGCVGREVDMPLVEIAATSESQTSNTMRMVRAFAPRKSRVVEQHQIDVGKLTFFRPPEGTLRVITSSATAAEGAESSFVVADETEHWKPGNGGADLASTLLDNLAKSGSRMLETSNAWVPGDDTVAEESWDAWLAQEEGRMVPEGGRILYDAVMAPADVDLVNRVAVFEALTQIYADCEWIDEHAIMSRIYSPKSRPEDSKRKYLNRPSAASGAWVSESEWDVCSKPDIKVEFGDEITMFFDGSKSRDATALVGCRISDGHVFLIDAWERPLDAGDDWQVPVEAVDAAVDSAFATYSVLAFFADVREWESFAHVTWPQRHGDELLLWAQKQGRNASPIAWDMRSHVMDFTLGCEAAWTDIRELHLTHDGNPLLRRHVLNARTAENRWGVSIKKESPDSPRKIDAAVCAIGARTARRHLLASSEWAQRGQSQGKQPGRVVGWG